MDGKVSERLKDTGCEWIRVCWCGLNGAWKCKTVHVGIVEQLHKRGVGLTRADPGLLLALDAIAYGDPVGEVRLLPDWSTLRALPYSRGHVAVCANVDWELDARCFLRRMVARLETEHKLRLRAAFEEEFYLLAGSDADGWKPVDSSTYASVSSFQRASEVLTSIGDALRKQGVQLEMMHAESGGGQFEIVWTHQDALTAADHHMVCKETVQAVARQCGYKATFVPKLSSTTAGSGAHTHLSLQDGDGRNIMADFGDPSSVAARWTAGLLHHLPALAAIGLPTANSYARAQPGGWAGSHQCWGVSNKEATVRVCNWSGATTLDDVRDVELKCCDGTANPYLWLGAVIAAGMDGVAGAMVLPEQVGPRPEDMAKMTRLPEDLPAALNALAADQTLCGAMGAELSACFLAVKRKETLKASDLGVLLERF